MTNFNPFRSMSGDLEGRNAEYDFEAGIWKRLEGGIVYGGPAGKTHSITEEALQEMFGHYIMRRRYNNASYPNSQDGLWSGGECSEAEKWFALFGIDTSYAAVKGMVNCEEPVRLKFIEN